MSSWCNNLLINETNLKILLGHVGLNYNNNKKPYLDRFVIIFFCCLFLLSILLKIFLIDKQNACKFYFNFFFCLHNLFGFFYENLPLMTKILCI